MEFLATIIAIACDPIFLLFFIIPVFISKINKSNLITTLQTFAFFGFVGAAIAIAALHAVQYRRDPDQDVISFLIRVGLTILFGYLFFIATDKPSEKETEEPKEKPPDYTI